MGTMFKEEVLGRGKQTGRGRQELAVGQVDDLGHEKAQYVLPWSSSSVKVPFAV